MKLYPCGSFPRQVIVHAYRRQGGRCAKCGIQLLPPDKSARKPKHAHAGQAHHLRPPGRGGKDHYKNCAFLCVACHQEAGHKMPARRKNKTPGQFSKWEKLKLTDLPFAKG